MNRNGHPAGRFDREAALRRLAEHPEAMPPHPQPYRANKHESYGLDTRVVGMMFAGGLALGALLGLAGRTR